MTNNYKIYDYLYTENLYFEQGTKVLDWLYVSGTNQLEDIINEIDFWIEFNSMSDYRTKQLKVPEKVTKVNLGFDDGDLDGALRKYPIAKALVKNERQKNKNAKILLSCAAGISRSATMALWLMAEELDSYDKAWDLIKSIRPIVDPDPNFEPIIDTLKARYNILNLSELLLTGNTRVIENLVPQLFH